MVRSIRQTLLNPLNINRRVDLIWRSRVRYITDGKDHLSLATGPKIFLHLIPLSVEPFSIDKYDRQLDDHRMNFPLLFGRFPQYRHFNVDGFLGFLPTDKVRSEIASYYQVFWDGSIEFCDTLSLKSRQVNGSEIRQISLPHFEMQFIKSLQAVLRFLKPVQVPLPIRVCLAIVGAQGYIAVTSGYPFIENHSIDRNEIFFDPITLDGWETDLGRSFRPLFNQLWNAGNFVCSPSYDENGDWKPRSDWAS